MKQTVGIPKIALFNMSIQGMNSCFNMLVRDLSRSGHELVACGHTYSYISQLDVSVIKTEELLARQGNFSKVTVAVLDEHVPEIQYTVRRGGTKKISVKELIYDLLDNDPSASIITHHNQYKWLIKKISNVYGVRQKDKNWLAVKASIMFGFDRNQVLTLLEKIRPKEPKLLPTW